MTDRKTDSTQRESVPILFIKLAKPLTQMIGEAAVWELVVLLGPSKQTFIGSASQWYEAFEFHFEISIQSKPEAQNDPQLESMTFSELP